MAPANLQKKKKLTSLAAGSDLDSRVVSQKRYATQFNMDKATNSTKMKKYHSTSIFRSSRGSDPQQGHSRQMKIMEGLEEKYDPDGQVSEICRPMLSQ